MFVILIVVLESAVAYYDYVKQPAVEILVVECT